MANEGELPKIDGDILYASEVNDNTSNVSFMEIVNRVTDNTSGTAFQGYDNMLSENFWNGTNGRYGNIQANSGLTWVDLSSERGYMITPVLYDTFSGTVGSLNQTLWTSGVWNGGDNGGQFKYDIKFDNTGFTCGAVCSGTMNNNGVGAGSAFFISDQPCNMIYIPNLRTHVDATGVNKRECAARVLFGSTVISDKYDITTADSSEIGGSVYNDLVSGQFLLMRRNTDFWDLYIGSTYKRTFSGLTGSFQLATACRSYNENPNGAANFQASVYADAVYLSGNSAGSLFANIKKTLNTANSIFNYIDNGSAFDGDFTASTSTDSGAAWEVDNGTYNTWQQLDGDNSLVQTCYKLTGSEGISPLLKGYSWRII